MRNAGFAEMIDFTRPGSATYVDADGVIRIAAANVPRFDYTNGRRQLLLEAPATGLCGAETNPRLWLNTGATASDFATPFGALDKAVSVQSGGETWHRRSIIADVSLNAGDRLSMRWIVRFGSSNSVRLSVRNQDLALESYVNIGSDGSSIVGSAAMGPLSAIKVEQASDGVLQVSATVTLSDAAATIQLSAGPNSGVAGEDMILYAGQVEMSDYASSLIYNDTSGVVTRPADKAQLGETVAALLRRGEVSVLVQGCLQAPLQNGRLLGTASPHWALGQNGSTGSGVNAWNGLVPTQMTVSPGSGALLNDFGAAVVLDGGGTTLAANGEVSLTNATATRSSYDLSTQFYLGRSATANYISSGWYDRLVIWPFRISDADLQRLAVSHA